MGPGALPGAVTPVADARAAVAFLTRIPAHDPRRPLDAAALSRAALWFPAVGLLVGGVMGATRLLADLAVDPGPATVLALLAAVLVTGGFHEDGLADAADGIGAHVSRERKLEILHDSRIGTYGALAVAFMIVFPLTVLAPLDGEHVLRAALAAHVLARWSTIPQAWLLPPARTDGSAALLRTSAATTLAATACALAVAMLAGGVGPGALAFGVAAVLTAGGGALFVQALGGITGDTLGAINKVVELATYAALAAAWAHSL